MHVRTAIIAVFSGLALGAASGCAKTETPEEARAASSASQSAYDQRNAEARAAASEEASANEAMLGSANAAIAEGAWTVAETGEGTVASYGIQGRTPLLTVRCGEGGGVEMRRPETTVAAPTTSFVSLPEGESRVTATADPADRTAAFLFVPPGDPFIERLIDSNGPITVRANGARLAVPTGPELVSLVSGCTASSTATTPAPITAPAAGAGS